MLCMTGLLGFADEADEIDNKFEKLKAAAEQGNSIAQFGLGLMYHKGEGMPTDKKQAFYWFKKSRRKGKYGCAV